MKAIIPVKQTKFLCLLCFLCFLCLPASLAATTVTGTINKPDGSPVTGTIEFVLSQPARTTTPPVMFAPVKTTCAVTNGLIASGCQLQGNDTLDPAGTFYRVRVLDSNNRVVLPSANYTFSGSLVDLGALPVTATDTLVPPTGSVTGALNVTGNLTVGGSATFGADPQDFAHLRLLGQTADPATVADGSVFHRSDLNRIRFRAGGLEVFDGTQYLPVSTPASQTFEFGGNIQIPNLFAATFKRVNDIRLVDPNLWTEATVPGKIDAAIAEFGANPGLVLLPTNLGAGEPTTLPANITLLDLRTAGQFHLDPRPTGGLAQGAVLEVNFAEPKITDTANFNAGIILNAIGPKPPTNLPAVNGLWLNCRHGLDSCLGMTQWGRMFNGFLMDIQPIADSGSSIYGIHLAQFDTAAGFHYWQVPFRISGIPANLGPEAWIDSDGGSGQVFHSGQLWLRKGDSNQRRAALTAPGGVVSATTADTGTLVAGHYRFKVTAFNDVGESLPSTATTDLVITANQVIEVTWNRVVGARGYRVYAVFNASADPGTANVDYWAQEPQTGGGVILKRLQNEDDLGDGVGTDTFKLWDALATSNAFTADPNTSGHPPDADTTSFFYLRASANSNNGRDPTLDRFNANEFGHWTFRPQDTAGDPFHIEYPTTNLITTFLRISDKSTAADFLSLTRNAGGGADLTLDGAGVNKLFLKGNGTGPDFSIVGSNTGVDVRLSVVSGFVEVNSFEFGTNGTFQSTLTTKNTWGSLVTPGDADGAFKLSHATAFTSTQPFLILRGSATEFFTVFGDGSSEQDGDVKFKSGTAFLGSFAHAITAARIWTLPDATTTLVGTDTTDTLSNKTLSSPTISGGINNDGGGFKHARLTTGSVAAGSSAAVTITWTTPFADANYTVNCSLIEATAGTSTLRLHHLESVAAASVTVRVVNDDGAAAHTGTLHCIAVHD